MRVIGEPGGQVPRERGQRIGRRSSPDAGPALPPQMSADGLAVTFQVPGDRRDRPPPGCQSLYFYIFSLCEY